MSENLICLPHNKRSSSSLVGSAVFLYLPVGLTVNFEVQSLCAQLTTLFTTKGSAKTTAKIAQWSVMFLEINFQTAQLPAVRSFMIECLSRLPQVAQDSLIKKEYVLKYALA